MNKTYNEQDENISRVARRMVEQYVQGLLSVKNLEDLMWQEVDVASQNGWLKAVLSQQDYMRIAQRICSHTLYSAWRSPAVYLKERAFNCMRYYLERTLKRSSYVEQWPHASQSLDDVLHEALETLYKLSIRDVGGPNDPGCFIKWTQTIAIRAAYSFAEHDKHIHRNIQSLEEQCELFSEQFVEESEPLKEFLSREVQDILLRAVFALDNPRYRQVLFYTYFLGLDGAEVAVKMGVERSEIYTWRKRALNALRKRPEIVQLLHPI